MITIRLAEENDYETLKKMYREFIDTMNQYDPSDDNMDEEVDKWIKKGIKRVSSVIYLAEFEQKIIGFMRLQNKEREDENKCLIQYVKLSDLFVDNMFRNKGTATELLNQAIIWSNENEAAEIVLNVYEANTNARKLYDKHGYHINEKLSFNRIRMVKSLGSSSCTL